MRELPSPLLRYCFEDFKVPTHQWKLFCQPVTFVYSLIVSVGINFIISKLGLQLGTVITATAGILFFEVLSNIRHSRLEQYSTVVMYVLAIIYMLLKTVTMADGISESTRQYNLGIPMAVILAVLIAAGVLFAVIIISMMIFQVSKEALKNCRKKDTSATRFQRRLYHMPTIKGYCRFVNRIQSKLDLVQFPMVSTRSVNQVFLRKY